MVVESLDDLYSKNLESKGLRVNLVKMNLMISDNCLSAVGSNTVFCSG